MNSTLKTGLQFTAGAALGFVLLGSIGKWHLPTAATLNWRPIATFVVASILSFVFYKLTQRKAYDAGFLAGRIKGRQETVSELGRAGVRRATNGLDKSLTNAVKSN